MKRLSFLLATMLLIAACGDKKDTDPPAKLVDIKAQLKVHHLWSYKLGGKSDRLRLALRATIVDNVAYAAGYNGEVVALNADTGKNIWRVKTKLPLSAGPSVGEGLVIAGASDGLVIALDAKTGEERWRHQVSSEVLAAPAIAKDLVIVRTVDGRLIALAASDAKQRWTTEQTVPRLSLRGTAPPIVVGDSVITGFDNGRVVAVDLSSGETHWDTAVSSPKGRNELERLVDIDAPVHVIGDDVFVTGFQGRVAMLARDSGQIWWARDFSSYRGFAVADDEMFATNAESEVVAMHRNDGSVAWEQKGLHQRGLTAPANDGTSLVVGDYQGYLHWLSSKDGAIIARTKTNGDRITNAPLAVDGKVFVQTDGGKLFAFRVEPEKTATNKVAPDKLEPNKVEPGKVETNKADANKAEPNS